MYYKMAYNTFIQYQKIKSQELTATRATKQKTTNFWENIFCGQLGFEIEILKLIPFLLKSWRFYIKKAA
jgi:hypothetical protein